jgi:U3 small nucleolar RNA-associated protein 4
MGNVTFWDARTNTQVQSHKAHKSDVLALAIGSNGKTLYSASTDQRISEFTLLPATSSRKATWSLTTTRRVHSHDVRALLYSPHYELFRPKAPSPAMPMLLSGGLDMSLQLTPCAKNFEANVEGTSVRYGPLSNSSDCSFASGGGRALSYLNQTPSSRLLSYSHDKDLIMLRRPDGCSIWRFNEDRHARVLNLKLTGLTNTTVGSMSPDGQWVILGDLWRLKLWQLHHVSTSLPLRPKAHR